MKFSPLGRRGWCGLSLVLLGSCGGGGRSPGTRPTEPALTLQPLTVDAGTPGKAPKLTAASAAPRAHLVGRIERAAVGPFLAQARGDGLAAWIIATERGAGSELVTVALGADGAPLGDPRVVASVPRETTSLVVRPTGRGRKGWLVTWSAIADRGETITLLEITTDGAALGTPVDLQRTNDHVAWVDVQPTENGSVCIWAEETTAGEANILTARIDDAGRPAGVPVRVVRGVKGWAAAQTEGRLALAVVFRDRSASDTISWLPLDAQGRGVGEPVTIARTALSGEVALTATPAGWLLGWTDRSGEDPQVALASVDASGTTRGAVHPLNALGGSSLVGMASGAAGVALAWQDPRGRGRAVRPLRVAGVSVDGGSVTTPTTSLEDADGTPPVLTATQDGFALLLSARTCSAPENGGDCARVAAPTFVRFDAHLAPVQTEPVLGLDGRTPASLAWTLECDMGRCVALAAGSDNPTPIFSVDLSRRTSPYSPPLVAAPPAGMARVTGLVTVASGQPYSDLSAARVGDGTVLASLSPADKLKSGPDDHVVAWAFDDLARPLGDSTTLALHAHAVGRVAVASAPEEQGGGSAVAWVQVDSGDPQVHVARLDRRGRLSKDAELTTAKGDAASVALAWGGDGWLVAWVDARNGNGEVYAAKVSATLDHIGPGQRITHATGDAADVALAVRGGVAWLAWSDPRESPSEGVSDIYATTLDARTAVQRGDEVRVLATAAHSRSPALAPAGDGAIVAWIEEAPPGIDSRGAAMVAKLDARAHVIGIPAVMPLAGEGRPTTVALEPAKDSVRAFVARATRDDTTLDIAILGVDGAPQVAAWPVLDLDASPSFDVSLACAGDALFYVGAGATPGSHRIRRLSISWGR